MAVLRQRTPEQTVVSSGNDPKKRTLADVLKDVDAPGPTPVEYSEVPAALAAALVNAGLMLPEPEGGE